MGQRIIITEDEKKNIQSLYEDFTGIEDGKIGYETSSGDKVLYKITHPASNFDVIKFNMNNGTFKIKGNFLAGTHEGEISGEKLNYITNNMDNGKESFKIMVGKKEDTEITFEKI